MLTVCLYPFHVWLTARLNGRPRLSAVLVTLSALLLLALPSAWIAVTLADSVRTVYERIDFASVALPHPPASIKTWPVIGEQIYELWTSAVENIGDVILKLGPQLRSIGAGFLRIGADAGLGVVSFLVAILAMGFLLPASDTALTYVHGFARRLDPKRGDKFVLLTAATIRAVARGVIGIAVLQTIVAGLGFVLFGIPQASLLSFAVLILCIVQIGAGIVAIPVVIWAWTVMATGPAILFTAYMLGVTVMDNALKPFLLGRGLQAPMLAILVGVIGGALSFGITGVFLGPIVLTVVWTLFLAWIDETGPA